MSPNDSISHSELETRLAYKFTDQSLLTEALTHKSYAHEHNSRTDYERLEFLGDAVLQLIVTEYLLAKYRDYDEGTLSKLRSFFVSEVFLCQIARTLHLGDCILLGKGEIVTGGSGKNSLLCDIFESLIAALYLDGGFNIARAVVITLMGDRMDEAILERSFIDSKTELQKYTQKHYGTLPHYTIIREEGPEHEKLFEVNVRVEGNILATGTGRTKKTAEKDAAYKALLVITSTANA